MMRAHTGSFSPRRDRMAYCPFSDAIGSWRGYRGGRAVGANLPAMAVWGAAIVVVIAAGFALLFVGLVVAAPVIGHATWHAYRALVEPAAD